MPTIKDYQQRIYNTAIKCGVNDVQAKIIAAQATHESGNFKSNVFLTDNNAFGMKMPSRRSKKYIARPSKIVMRSEGATPYAHYNSVEDGIKDLILSWHAYNKTDWNKIKTPEDYAIYLKSKNYYGDSVANYLRNLVYYFGKLNWLKFTSGLTVVVAIVFIAIFLNTK